MSNQNSVALPLFLALTVLAGVLINLPYHNFQDYLAQGDHGRDLYAAQAVLRGDKPYQDFWWVYGPLMPYYYGLFFKIFGVQVPSVLLGKIILNVAAGAFFFLAFARIFTAAAAFTAAAWFMNFHSDFFFTYNHAGGIALTLAAVWMHCAYLQTGRLSYVWGALFAVFVLGLVKINFAATALFMTIVLVTAKSFLERTFLDKRLFYAASLIFLPLLWLGIYAFFLQGLSSTEIRQCLPYLGGDEPYNKVGPLQTLPILVSTIFHNISASWLDLAVCALTLLSAAQAAYLLLAKKLSKERAAVFCLLLAYLGLFYAVNLHEFLKSGVFYRAFWSQPFSMFLMFAVIAAATELEQRWVRLLIWLALGLVVLLSAYTVTQNINAYKNGQHFLGGSRGQVYVTNDRSWLQTVVLTTRQLQTALKNDELFFALPYDCLYYYLTGKKSPTRQLIFFDHIKIPPEQEQKIIAGLEARHIAMVLVSSRQSARETGLGTLGETYCPFIAQYINANFTPVAKIGDWAHEPGWAWNHGTLLFKRK